MDKFRQWQQQHGISFPMAWSKVVFADECWECEYCDDLICPVCEDHYAECDHIGPTEDNVIYHEDNNGIMWGKRSPESLISTNHNTII